MTALEMILDAVTVIDSDYGQSFTVDGVDGTFRGILTTPSEELPLEIDGFKERITALLAVAKPTTITPEIGLRITSRGVNYKIIRIDDEQTHYAFGLEGVNQ